jgi:hypothetical protein
MLDIAGSVLGNGWWRTRRGKKWHLLHPDCLGQRGPVRVRSLCQRVTLGGHPPDHISSGQSDPWIDKCLLCLNIAYEAGWE